MTLLQFPSPPAFLKLLAHELRWDLLTALAHSDLRVQELVEIAGRPMNLVSYHLKQLRDQELVHERRSSADARDVYYSLDLERLEWLYTEAGSALHPVLGERRPKQREPSDGKLSPVRVLFLCTHNSARSQMAEGLLRHLGGKRVEVYSAGSEPATVHPLAIRVLKERQVDISGQRAKHMSEFAGQTFDYIITVCDRVREECPVLLDDPERIHWSFPDPVDAPGSEEERYRAFRQIARDLATRLNYFLLIIDRMRDG